MPVAAQALPAEHGSEVEGPEAFLERIAEGCKNCSLDLGQLGRRPVGRPRGEIVLDPDVEVEVDHVAGQDAEQVELGRVPGCA
jgi:hypothetical protein